MNTPGSQKTPLRICILQGIGISTFMTADTLLYCKHESMPTFSGSRRKGLFSFLFISRARGERVVQLQAKHTQTLQGQVGWLTDEHIRALVY